LGIYRQLKADEELADIPVIIVSARKQARDAAAGFAISGNDRYVEKPFDVHGLINTVYEMLGEPTSYS
jgi:DNA-binding response OmpR family regulator